MHTRSEIAKRINTLGIMWTLQFAAALTSCFHCSRIHDVKATSNWSEHIVSQVSVRFAISLLVCTPPEGVGAKTPLKFLLT